MFDVINSDIIKVIPRAELDSSYNLIEGCESAGQIGRDYVVVVEKARINELVDELCCGQEKNKADIMKRLNLNILPDLILGTCDDDESEEADTLTEYLVLKLGSMDEVLKHYGLLTKTPEEEAAEAYVNNHNLLEEGTSEDEVDDYIDDDDSYDPYDDDLEGVVDDFMEEEGNAFSQFNNFREDLKEEDEDEEEESENAYSMLHKLEEHEEKEDILAPSNLYTDKGEEDMYEKKGYYEPPSNMGGSIKKDAILSIQTKNIYEKEEVPPVPTSDVSSYRKVEPKEEESTVDTEEALVLKEMVRVICDKMNFNYEDVLKEAEHQVELAKNPNFTEEEMKNALSKLLCARVITGVEHDFYIENFEKGQVETVTKILREKLQTIEGSL